MDRALPREDLRTLLDQVTREITQREAGIILDAAELPRDGPEDETCTVYTSFDRGMDTSLSLRADTSMFVRLARGMMQTEDLTPEDV